MKYHPAQMGLLFFLFLLFSNSLVAQNTIKIKGGQVFQQDVHVFDCKETKEDKWTNYYEILSKSGQPQAHLMFLKNGNDVIFNGYFASLGYYYECRYPAGTGIETILESYIKNKVIVDDKANLEGLNAYCAARNMPLKKNVPPPQSKHSESSSFNAYSAPQKNSNSSASQPAQLALPQNISFTLKSNATKTIRYFIGKEPKYGSGRYSNLGSNNITTEHGTEGDKFCIVDEHDNPISCTTISSGTRIEINKDGTGFGY